jgi:aspartyl-tRNA(Asn)/glutamyl-tRNA(Gln) amidotransferase subunit A
MPPPLQAHRLLISHRRLPSPARRRFTAASSLQSAPATTLAPGPATSSILSIRESLLSGERTAADITSEYLSRLRRTEPSLRSFIHVADAAAEREAEELDRRIASGEKDAVGPLAGVLVGVKDNLCTANMPSTGGSRILDGYRPAYDATAVRRLQEAGAIVVGKTNLDEFGMGSTTEGSAFQVGRPDPHIV